MRAVAMLCVWCATPFGVASSNEPGRAPSASAQLKELQQRLRQDKANDDWRAFLADAKRLRDFVHGSPSSQIEVARAELNLGDVAAAGATIARVLSTGATHPILATPAFQPVMDALAASRAEAGKAVRAGTVALTVADADLFTEDIAFDARRGRFFVTSIRRGAVVELGADGRATTFATSPDHWPMVALKIDARRRRLWATEVAFEGFASVPERDRGRSAVLEYHLDRKTLLRRIEGPPHGAVGDLVVLANGDAIVADGQGGGVYRVVARSLVRVDRGDFVSPQTPATCGDDRVLYVPDYVRGIAAMDLETGTVRWLAAHGEFALDETDGLYCDGRTLFAVQNGATHPRVVAFAMKDGDLVGMRLIERHDDGDFTHGVLVDGRLHYLAAAGWGAVDDAGEPKAGVVVALPLIIRDRGGAGRQGPGLPSTARSSSAGTARN